MSISDQNIFLKGFLVGQSLKEHRTGTAASPGSGTGSFDKASFLSGLAAGMASEGRRDKEPGSARRFVLVAGGTLYYRVQGSAVAIDFGDGTVLPAADYAGLSTLRSHTYSGGEYRAVFSGGIEALSFRPAGEYFSDLRDKPNNGPREVLEGMGLFDPPENMFSGCRALRAVDLSGAAKLSASQFHLCTGLGEIEIPEGIKSIPSGAFGYCYGLRSVTIPDGVTYIGTRAFDNCTALPALSMPDSVTETGNTVFCNCDALRSVRLSSGLTRLADSLFIGCSALESVAVPAGVTVIEMEAFRECRALASALIPEGVTEIGFEAFRGCAALTTLTLPSTLTSLGHYDAGTAHYYNAFSGSGLKTLICRFAKGSVAGEPWYATNAQVVYV